MIVRKVSGVVKDSIIYRYLPGKLRVDTIRVERGDKRREDALAASLNSCSNEKDKLKAQNDVYSVQVKSMRFKNWAFGIGGVLCLALAVFVFFKKKTSII